MPIDFYMIKFSPPCRAVMMLAKEINVELNNKVVDLSEGQHLAEDYLKVSYETLLANEIVLKNIIDK